MIQQFDFNDENSNTSNNPSFDSVWQARLNRRGGARRLQRQRALRPGRPPDRHHTRLQERRLRHRP